MPSRSTSLIAPLVAVTLAAPGCFSIARTADRPTPYAGVRFICDRWPEGSGGWNPGGTLAAIAFNVVAPFDLPLSFALDTLLLPITGLFGLQQAWLGAGEPEPVRDRADRPPTTSGVVPRRAPTLIVLDASPAMRMEHLGPGGQPGRRALREAAWLLTSVRDGTPVAVVDTTGASPWSGLRPADDEARRLAEAWLARDRDAEAEAGLAPAVTDLLRSGAVEQVVVVTTLTRRTGDAGPPEEVVALLAALEAAWPRGECTLDVIAVGPISASAEDLVGADRQATARGGRLAIVGDLR